jgi:hypothetical protein
VAAAVVVDELCRIGVDELDVDGMALIAISDHGDRVTLASSGPFSTRVAELQMTTGEGPGLDAFTIRRPVLGPDMSTTAAARRWPGFAASAVEIGVRAVFAIPLQAGVICCGTLQLHRQHPGPLTPRQLRDALTLAEAGLWALLEARAGVPPDQPSEPFGGGQDEVFQASGMISVQLSAGVDEALVRLRAHAYAHDRSIADVAHDVIARRIRFERTPELG